MLKKYPDDEAYISHSFEDLYKFTKETENQILIDSVEAVKDSIITNNKNQHLNIPTDASLKISEIFSKIPKENLDIRYFSDWKDELILYLGRLRSANKSGIQFAIWGCRMNVLKTIEKMVLAHNKLSQSYDKTQHEQEEESQ